MWISSKVDNSNKIHVQNEHSQKNKWIFIKEKLNEVEVHQYESKLMVVHIYEDTPEPLFSPSN